MSERRRNAIRQTIVAGIALLIPLALVAHCFGCSSPAAKPAVYGVELAACTAAADHRLELGLVSRAEACQESIRCENALRARQTPPRPPRAASLDCR